MPANPLLGAPIPRREDRRLLCGRGHYVTDLSLPAMVHAVFVRSPFAHADVHSVDLAPAAAAAGVVDVVGPSDPQFEPVAVRSLSELSTYRATAQPVLARRVRFAGEAVAVVVAEHLHQAVDAAGLVEVDYEVLPPVLDVLAATSPGSPTLHVEADGNVLLERQFEQGDVDGVLAGASLTLRRTFTTNRQTAAPLEGRATAASWDGETLTVWTGTQVPHTVRYGLAETLGFPENRLRVIAPDVGGGFGIKGILYPEDVAVCLLSMRTGRPVKWVETRSEGLAADAHARDHRYEVVAGFAADGRLLALDARIHCDVGAYSVYPWTAGLEPLMAAGLLAGPYKVATYRCATFAVCTNKSPAGPYRGVARPATVFVMERLVDSAARRLGLDRAEIRRRNLVGPDDLPYTAATKLVHDSPSYPAALETVLDAVDYDRFPAEQQRLRREGRYVGIGLAVYNELTALGKAASAGPRMLLRTGHEAVTVRVDPSGTVTVLAGVTSQGQGLETTMAQVVAGELGVPYDSVDVKMGDTGLSLFGFGAFSSRQGVIGGGAAVLAAQTVRQKVVAIAAHVLEAAPADLDVVDGRVQVRGTPTRSVSVAEVASVAYLQPHRLPPGVEAGLEATRFFDPERGTFAAGAQAAVVEVDVETGAVHLRRIVCAEDAGRRLNPIIVEGQVHGAIAQGVAGALFEHLCYDEHGQLVTGTLADYLMPSAAELPGYEVHHVDVPSTTNPYGLRGVGEGGTLGPAAAIGNAVSDALVPFGIEVDDLPITPQRLFELLHRARAEDPSGKAKRAPGSEASKEQ